MWNGYNPGNIDLDIANHKPTCTLHSLHSELVTITGTGNGTVVTPMHLVSLTRLQYSPPYHCKKEMSTQQTNVCLTAKYVPNSGMHCVLYLEYHM